AGEIWYAEQGADGDQANWYPITPKLAYDGQAASLVLESTEQFTELGTFPYALLYQKTGSAEVFVLDLFDRATIDAGLPPVPPATLEIYNIVPEPPQTPATLEIYNILSSSSQRLRLPRV